MNMNIPELKISNIIQKQPKMTKIIFGDFLTKKKLYNFQEHAGPFQEKKKPSSAPRELLQTLGALFLNLEIGPQIRYTSGAANYRLCPDRASLRTSSAMHARRPSASSSDRIGDIDT